MYQKTNTTGMTFIELLLALTLSILIINFLFEMYLTAADSKTTQKSFVTIQEDAQMINQILKHDLQSSTYFGCARLTNDFPFKNTTSFLLNNKNRIEPYHDGDVKSGTDAIRIWHSSIHSAVLFKKMRGYSTLYVTSNIPFAVGDYLIISDCKTAETLQIKQFFQLNDGTIRIIPSSPLSKLYDINSEVNTLEIESYYIGKTDRLDKYHQPVYALFSKDINGNKTELVEGVSQMKISFSTIENNLLIEHPMNELTNSAAIKGMSFAFDIFSASIKLHKKWYLYVATHP